MKHIGTAIHLENNTQVFLYVMQVRLLWSILLMLSPRFLSIEHSFNSMLLQLYPLLSLPKNKYGFGQDIRENHSNNERGLFTYSEKPSFKVGKYWVYSCSYYSLYSAIIGVIWTSVNNFISFFTIDQAIAMRCVHMSWSLDHFLVTFFIDHSILDWPMLKIFWGQKFQSI